MQNSPLSRCSTGGTQGCSDAIYALSARLQSDYPERPIQLLDWGMGNQLLFLSAGKLHTHEPFWKQMTDSVPHPAFLEVVRDRKNVFVWHSAPQMAFPKMREALETAARQSDLQLKIQHVFNERSGSSL